MPPREPECEWAASTCEGEGRRMAYGEWPDCTIQLFFSTCTLTYVLGTTRISLSGLLIFSKSSF
eukprot:SAG31_NODE_27699_length_421_cov_1.369565_1_plen_63_part_10